MPNKNYSQQKRLIISPLESYDLNDSENMVFLKTNCFSGKEHQFNSYNSFTFIEDPFLTQDQLLQAEKFVENFTAKFIIEYSAKNKAPSYVKEPISFWSIMLNPFITSLCENLFRDYKQISQNIKKGCFKIQLASKIHIPRPKNTVEFMYLMLTDSFNYWFISNIIKILQPNNVSYKEIDNQSNYNIDEDKILPVSELTIKQKSINKLNYFIDKLLLNRNNLTIVGLNPIDKLILSLKSNKFCHYNRKTNVYTEDFIVENEYPGFSMLFNYFFEKLYPRVLLGIDGMKRKKIGGLAVIDASYWYDEDLKYRLALNYINSKIIVYQHGSGYGIPWLYTLPFLTEYKISDYFLSWGWEKQSHYQIKALPCPSFSLSKHYNTYKYSSDKNAKVIIVETSRYNFQRGFYSGYDTIYNSNKSDVDKIIRFIHTLKPEFSDNLYLRPYPEKRYTFNVVNYIENSISGIKNRIIENDFKKELINCRCIIMNHPGTTFNIAMVMNIPGIYFWDDRRHIISEQAQPVFDTLREVGILHNNPEQASKKYNEIGHDIHYWWNTTAVQKARLNFINTYALVSPNYINDFYNIIHKAGA